MTTADTCLEIEPSSRLFWKGKLTFGFRHRQGI